MRGVAVDAILKNLLEMQLVRVVGRSELPGRPWMFGTTQKFMEHFGLKSLDDLPGTDELRRLEAEQNARARKPGAGAAGEAPEVVPEHPNQMKIEVVEAQAPAEPTPEEAVGEEGDEELFEREGRSEEDIVGGGEEDAGGEADAEAEEDGEEYDEDEFDEDDDDEFDDDEDDDDDDDEDDDDDDDEDEDEEEGDEEEKP